MKKITVYGPGCLKCKKTEEIVRQVLAETKITRPTHLSLPASARLDGSRLPLTGTAEGHNI